MKKTAIKIKSIPAIVWGESANRVYIYAHGKLSRKEDAQSFAEKVTQRGYQVLSFDLPEHGERTNEHYPCTVWNAVHDLEVIGEYALRNWSNLYLYGISLGVYFSLLAYKDLPLRKSLFLSPVLDMEHLIQNMMKWFDVSEQMLMEKKEIPTPMGEILSWDYYCYVKENPIEKWNSPTAILYGSNDNLTERDTIDSFVRRFNCDLTVLSGSEHYFHTEGQLNFWGDWLDKNV